MKFLNFDLGTDQATLEISTADLSLLNDIATSSLACYEATELGDRGIERDTVSALAAILNTALAESATDHAVNFKISPSQFIELSYIAGAAADSADRMDFEQIGIPPSIVELMADRVTRLISDAVPAAPSDPTKGTARFIDPLPKGVTHS